MIVLVFYPSGLFYFSNSIRDDLQSGFIFCSEDKTMEEKTILNRSVERKSESRTIFDKFHSVQFSLNYMGPTYLFKLRDISSNGLCILVKEDSSVLKELKVGDILDMEYNAPGLSDSAKLLKTQISSKNCHDRFTGHSLVGLSIIDKQDGGL